MRSNYWWRNRVKNRELEFESNNYWSGFTLRYCKKKIGHAGLTEKFKKFMQLTLSDKQEIILIWLFDIKILSIKHLLRPNLTKILL